MMAAIQSGLAGELLVTMQSGKASGGPRFRYHSPAFQLLLLPRESKQ